MKTKINPEWLDATHCVLWMHPKAPSFEEQIRLDQEAEKKARETANQPADEEKP